MFPYRNLDVAIDVAITGSDNVLGLFRFYSFIQCTYIGGNQLWRRGTGVLYFYTVMHTFDADL